MSNSKKELIPFAAVALGWLALSVTIRRSFSPTLLGFWALCILDLLALTNVCRALLAFAAGTVENKPAMVVNASVWGMIKLACLALFAVAMIRSSHLSSQADLFWGLGTMIVVPLLGGLWWSQRSLSISVG